MLRPGASLTSSADLCMSIDLACAASVAAAAECVALDAEHAQKNRAMSAGERVLQIVTGFLILRLKSLARFFLSAETGAAAQG